MKLIIFGATGTVGRPLVEQALAQDHQVTAFARNPAVLSSDDAKLALRAGDVLDPVAVADAVAGHDAALITLGSGRKGTVRSVGTRHVIDAMEEHGLRRLVCQTTLGCGDSWANLNFFWKRVMFGGFIREAFADHEAQEAYVRASTLDWTLVRPAAFTDGGLSGAYRHGFPATTRDITLKIPRADVADFMLRQLGDDTYLQAAPGLSL